MAGFSTDKDRKVIPRWRTFDITLRLRELESVTPSRAHQQVTSDFLAPKIIDWLEHQTVGHAADLVGTALSIGKEKEVSEVARFLLRNDLNVSPWARELAEHALRTPEENEIVSHPEALEEKTLHRRIGALRNLLRTEPRDPISWVELSRAYAILGLEEQAKQSMTVAVQLAMNNRFVLRSASRLWIYLDDIEKAHDLIVRADRTPHDPWLLAAEIAIGNAAERKSKFVKTARRMLTERRFPPAHISELASAVATLELGSGSIKRSRRLFDLSLENPTENSIAQAAWASRQNSIIRLNEEYLDRPKTFEARYWSFYSQGQWEKAIDECKLWHFDQPFSSRPSTHGSYVSAIALEDYATSEWFAKKGLLANRSDFTLLNNLAFACINQGNMEGAKKALSRVKRSQLSDQDWVVLQATQGLLAFRTGNVAVGRQLYLDARSEARKMQDNRLFALASAFYAIEEVSQGISDGSSVLSAVVRGLQRGRETDPIFRALEVRLSKMIPSHKRKDIKNRQ